jgi:hypothetical protein
LKRDFNNQFLIDDLGDFLDIWAGFLANYCQLIGWLYFAVG